MRGVCSCRLEIGLCFEVHVGLKGRFQRDLIWLNFRGGLGSCRCEGVICGGGGRWGVRQCDRDVGVCVWRYSWAWCAENHIGNGSIGVVYCVVNLLVMPGACRKILGRRTYSRQLICVCAMGKGVVKVKVQSTY